MSVIYRVSLQENASFPGAIVCFSFLFIFRPFSHLNCFSILNTLILISSAHFFTSNNHISSSFHFLWTAPTQVLWLIRQLFYFQLFLIDHSFSDLEHYSFEWMLGYYLFIPKLLSSFQLCRDSEIRLHTHTLTPMHTRTHISLYTHSHKVR